MDHNSLLRRFALVFTLGIALVALFFVTNSSAAPAYIVHGATTASCSKTKHDAQAGYQNGIVGSELHGYWRGEHVTVSFEFPDGRLFSGTAAELLDGVVDMPPNYATDYFANPGGDLYFEHPITNKWPFGCYTFFAHGDSSNQTAVGNFVVLGQLGVPGPNPATLNVWNNGTSDSFAIHDSLVMIHGANFRPDEGVSIWVTQPNGTVIDYPQQITSNTGSFESTFQFTSVHQTGRYTFTALGISSGYQVFAPFELRPGSSTPSGWATLRVAYPSTNVASPGVCEIVGSLFAPNERIDLWMTLPGNGVRDLPSQMGDDNGNFFATIALDERLPLGHYSITAKGANSGRLVISSFDVFPGVGPIEVVPTDTPPSDVPPSPAVVDSNTAAGTSSDLTVSGDGAITSDPTLGGPTNIDGAQNNAGPEVTLPFRSAGMGNP